MAFRRENAGGRGPVEQWVGGDLLPEAAQLFDPLGRLVARDDGRVDGADGDAGNPVGIDVGRGERLVGAGLIGAERAPTLQDQGDAFERQSPFGCSEIRVELDIHGRVSFFT